jgi:predicted PurR-regulated permease PerM
MTQENKPSSETLPPGNVPSSTWSATTKLLVGLVMVAIAGFLIVRFNNVIGPLLFAFVLAYLIRPIAAALSDRTGLKWRASVNVVFIAFLLLVISFFTITGVALFGQLNNLISLVNEFLVDLPGMIADLSTSTDVIVIPLTGQQIPVRDLFSGGSFDLINLAEQALAVLQPLVGQAGGLLGTLAGSAFGVIGWGIFVFFFTYFLLSEAGRVPDAFARLDLPGQMDDLERMARELGLIWNAYLRGQLLLSFIVGFSYFFILLTLGVKNALALGVLAGLSRFVPYVGQWITSGTIAVSAFLQGGNYFGFEPFAYTLFVTVIILVIDQFVDGMLGPRIFSSALGVHPSALLVAAIVSASLLGFIGLILAAPVLASAQLFLRYTFRKMVDLNPWPQPERPPQKLLAAFTTLPRDGLNWLRKLIDRRKS